MEQCGRKKNEERLIHISFFKTFCGLKKQVKRGAFFYENRLELINGELKNLSTELIMNFKQSCP